MQKWEETLSSFSGATLTNVTFSFSSCPFSICSFPSCVAQSDHLPETSNSTSCLTFNASITSKTGNKQTRQSISSNLSVSPNICNSLTKGLKLHPLPLGKTEPGDANLEQSSAFQSASQTFTLLRMCWSKPGRFSHTCCTSYKEYDICCWQCAVSPLCDFSREETELQNLLQLLSTGKGNKLAPSSGRDVHGILLRIWRHWSSTSTSGRSMQRGLDSGTHSSALAQLWKEPKHPYWADLDYQTMRI